MWLIAIFVNIGMWCERFIIIVTSLHRDFLPSAWNLYAPTLVDWCLYIGTLGFFGTMFMLFLKFLPAVAVAEVKELNHDLRTGEIHGGTGTLAAAGREEAP